MLFRFGASYLLAAMLMIALTVALTLRRGDRPGVGLKDAAFGALVAAVPNTGFMGVPLQPLALGDRARRSVGGSTAGAASADRADQNEPG